MYSISRGSNPGAGHTRDSGVVSGGVEVVVKTRKVVSVVTATQHLPSPPISHLASDAQHSRRSLVSLCWPACVGRVSF